MAQVQELKAEARDGKGKGAAYRTRLKGMIPAIVYGGKGEPQPVALESRSLERHVEAGGFLTSLFMLDIGGTKTRVIPRQIQLDPVSDRPVHVGFMRLAEGATVRLEIPVHFKGQGESPGLKKGGVLNIVRHEMNVICPADNIPRAIEVDVSGLDIGESLHLADLSLPEGLKTVIKGRDFTICSVVAPTSVIEEQKAAAAAAAAAASAPVAAEGAPAEAPLPPKALPRRPLAPHRPPEVKPRPPRRPRSKHARGGASLRWTLYCWQALAIRGRNMRSTATMPVSSWPMPFIWNTASDRGAPNSRA